jgi:hypothetical protein
MQQAAARVRPAPECPGNHCGNGEILVPLFEWAISRPRVADKLGNVPKMASRNAPSAGASVLVVQHRKTIAIFPKSKKP